MNLAWFSRQLVNWSPCFCLSVTHLISLQANISSVQFSQRENEGALTKVNSVLEADNHNALLKERFSSFFFKQVCSCSIWISLDYQGKEISFSQMRIQAQRTDLPLHRRHQPTLFIPAPRPPVHSTSRTLNTMNMNTTAGMLKRDKMSLILNFIFWAFWYLSELSHMQISFRFVSWWINP